MLPRTFCAIILTAGLFLSVSCSDTDPEPAPTPASRPDTTKSLDDLYSNPEYDIALRMPSSWILVEEPLADGEHMAINLFKDDDSTSRALPLDIHGNAKRSYIAVWPAGIGTELPASQYASFHSSADTPALSFPVDTVKSKILLLQDGTPWAYFIVPGNPPEQWSDSGFIFAQIQTSDHLTTCFDEETGEKLPMEKCDVPAGDRFVREGTRNKRDARIINRVLQSISLKNIDQKKAASEIITVEEPRPDAKVTSPLQIKGEARGPWYAEGQFTISLYSSSDSLLSKTTAAAQGEWMQDQFVPFETTLNFAPPDTGTGRLVFERANPSGLPQHDQSYVVSVVFSSP
ncbi:Gmad2 immunoglobulin-like domain-containing protein [Fodinibius sediminis]|uniref:Immunoglobulin-like domain of spore germination n=1 Tax=Fodinibius sediminis TaxID=1214077 RepID=A0A521CH95_9BACT|nr:Gmad2 immunoglobulin-like domain-containing protein [Fodinibius sediminis]SMO58090.1 Immunoglobulin-like domain of spore germination [Fodinibius sediminis]